MKFKIIIESLIIEEIDNFYSLRLKVLLLSIKDLQTLSACLSVYEYGCVTVNTRLDKVESLSLVSKRQLHILLAIRHIFLVQYYTTY